MQRYKLPDFLLGKLRIDQQSEGMKKDDENARKLERARILPDEDETEHKSCFGRCRRSLHMSTALGFTILFLDAMLLTALGKCHRT